MKGILCSIFLSCCLAPSGMAQELIHALPSTLGMDGEYIEQKVDSIMELGIREQAFPGAQLLVAKNDTVIFHKAYGYHTYDSIRAVTPRDLYDLASVTKILGPLPALMKLVEQGLLDLDVPFSNYWEPWRKIEDKKDLTLREILSHQAGLIPYIAFQQKVVGKNGLKRRFVRHRPNARFQARVDGKLYVKGKFMDKIDRAIERSAVSPEKKYLYSGLSFLIFPRLIEQLTHTDYQHYLQENFYGPLGCHTLGYLPSLKHYGNPIVPTERDTFFRKSLVRGWVHDETAALMGGISGNAGLFGTADDLAKIMGMYQNYGTANGIQFLSPATVKEFIRVQYPENENRRGLGFDKPYLDNAELPLGDSYPSPLVSPESFGHSGFTGTLVWADPVNRITFIFLSNRVYPSREHGKLYSLNIRPALQHVFYTARNAKESGGN